MMKMGDADDDVCLNDEGGVMNEGHQGTITKKMQK